MKSICRRSEVASDAISGVDVAKVQAHHVAAKFGDRSCSLCRFFLGSHKFQTDRQTNALLDNIVEALCMAFCMITKKYGGVGVPVKRLI